MVKYSWRTQKTTYIGSGGTHDFMGGGGGGGEGAATFYSLTVSPCSEDFYKINEVEVNMEMDTGVVCIYQGLIKQEGGSTLGYTQ